MWTWWFWSLSGCGGLVAPTEQVVARFPTQPVTALRDGLADGSVKLLIDVRSAEEFASGHVPGAVNVPLEQVAGRAAELATQSEEPWVICASGNRSTAASHTLADHGLKPVNVDGGTKAWIRAGFPVE